MSRTYSLGCHDCKVEIWIGQGASPERRYLYTDQKHLDELQKFLFSHQRHQLGFYDDEGSEYERLSFFDDE